MLTVENVREWIPRLAGLPAKKRARLRGVSGPRARQILAGAIIAHATMKALDVAEVEVGPWALREGIVLQYLATIVGGQALPLQPLSRTPDATVTALSRH